MSKQTDYFFLNVKEMYPSFNRPAAIDEEIWDEMLNKLSLEDIKKALKDYRTSKNGSFAPLPAQFKEYVYPYQPKHKVDDEDELPIFPESYLMNEDIKAGRCKYFYPTYCAGVQYVLNVKLKEVLGEEKFSKTTYHQRYRLAVEEGLFGDFDKTLDIVAQNKGKVFHG